MNRYSVVSILLAGCLWLSSCQEDEGGSPPAGPPVAFTSGIGRPDEDGPSTRASDALWSPDDRIGIYMIPHNHTPGAPADLGGALDANTQYRTTTGGASTSLIPTGAAIEFPRSGSRVNFVAYYPYHTTLHTTYNHVYPVDVATQHPLPAIDLLYHRDTTGYDRTSTAVPLTFTHRLSKFVIAVVPATGVTADLSTATASLTGFPSRAEFNLADGSLTGIRTTTATLTPVKDAGASTASRAVFSSILVPHEGMEYTTRTVTLRIGGQNYSYTLPLIRNFETGTAYSYHFTFTGSKIVPAQNTITDWEGGTVAWGDNLLTCGKTDFSLPATASTTNSLTLSTTAMATPTVELSTTESEITTVKPLWVINVAVTKGATTGGWTGHTLTFDLIKNIYNTPRTGYIHMEISGLTIVVRITQAAGDGLYVNGPNPASFSFDPAAQTGKSFTVTTNSLETTATLSYSLDGSTKVAKPDWITVNAPVRSGSDVFTFTTTFNVTANASATAARTCYIHITVDSLEKSVRIDQASIYVNAPSPASFTNIIAAGKTGNTFTIKTNSPVTDITVSTNNTTLITNLIKSRGTVAADGSSTWTIGFNVSANTTTSTRSGNITVVIAGVTKTVSVSQVAVYLNNPVPSSFTNVAYTGATNSTFTLETNSTASSVGSLTSNNLSMLTNLRSARSTKDATNGIYTWTITFNVANNTSSSSRSATITVQIGGITKTVSVSQVGVPSVTVSANTNCHIVAPNSGTIRIPVTRAVNNGGMSSSASFTAVKLWDDNSVISSVGTEGSGSSGYITVTVNNSSRQGNALVALKSGSTIYWSWHIWVTSYNPNTAGSWAYNGYTFMDRNLGATDNTFSTASRGLFYQWGRKDPFPATDISGFSKVQGPTSQQTAHQNPDKFYYNNSSPYNWLSSQVDNLWGHNASKSVYDPCPEGWRVPSYKNNVSPWNGLTTSNFTWQGSGTNTGRQYSSTTTSRHPAAGYRSNGNGSLGNVGSYGYYWSASPYSAGGYNLSFGSSGVNPGSANYARAGGFSVRCSRE